jgi:hypothetical protein
MKRLTLPAITLGLVLGIGLSSAPAADSSIEVPTEPVRITNFGKKAPVVFDHAMHGEVACVDCHHNEADGQYKCGECHGLEVQAETPKIKDAMHDKAAGKCYRCHFGKEPEAKKLKCAECHVKR